MLPLLTRDDGQEMLGVGGGRCSVTADLRALTSTGSIQFIKQGVEGGGSVGAAVLHS